MAKVRLQARPDSADALEAVEGGPSTDTARPKRIPRYNGAIDVLTKVLKEQGLVGWYQVSILGHSQYKNVPNTRWSIAGNERSDNESRVVSGSALHVEGSV